MGMAAAVLCSCRRRVACGAVLPDGAFPQETARARALVQRHGDQLLRRGHVDQRVRAGFDRGRLIMERPALSWFGIVRLGLVQTGLGAIVVLTTSTLNREMGVELAMPAILPGALVAIHYALQVFRPAWGHGSDLGARRTPWIVGGMAMLATGGLLASIGTAWMATHPLFGVILAVFAFGLIGAGVGAAGTSLLVLLAKRTDEK